MSGSKSTDGLWTTFGADAVTLSLTLVVNGVTHTAVRTVAPDTWYAMPVGAREATKQELCVELADKLACLTAEVKVELPYH